MDRGRDGATLRTHNLALLLRLVAAAAPVSRADLAARTGLTRATVSTLVAELTEAGLVAESGAAGPYGAPRAGRPATPLAVAPHGPVGIGLSVQADHVAGYVADLAGRPTARELRRLPTHGDPGHALRASRPVLRRLLDHATTAGRFVAGVGVVAPATFTAAAPGEAHSVTLDWDRADLAGMLRAELAALGAGGIAVTAGNDTAAAAAAEARHGADPALYVGGESALGAVFTGLAPGTDVGHVTLRRTGPACPCGNRGCLTLYAGPRALSAAAPADRLLGNESAPPTARAVTVAATALADALRPVLAVTAPSEVVLGGYLRALPAAALRARLPGVTVRTARLGADAALRGAAAAGLAHILDSPATWLAQLD